MKQRHVCEEPGCVICLNPDKYTSEMEKLAKLYGENIPKWAEWYWVGYAAGEDSMWEVAQKLQNEKDESLYKQTIQASRIEKLETIVRETLILLDEAREDLSTSGVPSCIRRAINNIKAAGFED